MRLAEEDAAEQNNYSQFIIFVTFGIYLYKNMQRMLFLSLFLLLMDGKWISVLEVEIVLISF